MPSEPPLGARLAGDKRRTAPGAPFAAAIRKPALTGRGAAPSPPAEPVGDGNLPPPPPPPLPVAISECLMGRPVRYDGSHAASSLPGDALAGLLSFRPICPELGIGLGVPRPPVRLVGSPDAPLALGVDDPGLDVTEALADYGRRCAGQLGELCGYIFMERSPSCGLHGVKVHPPDGGPPHRAGRGIYARSLLDSCPLLPAEESGRLFDPPLREAFLDQVQAYAYWQRAMSDGLAAARLIAFHARHKYLLMAHSVPHYRRAGRLLADLRAGGRTGLAQGRSGGRRLSELGARYLACLLDGLGKPATRGGHGNALLHVQGHFKGRLPPAGRRRLAQCIEAYRNGAVPLSEPQAMLRRLLNAHPAPYLERQIYLQPLEERRTRAKP